MNTIQLSNKLIFVVEPYNGKLRFVVSEHGVEYACRIERKKAIETFLLTNDNEVSIFKGRLQLHRLNNEIAIEVKGQVVGRLSLSSFKKLCAFDLSST